MLGLCGFLKDTLQFLGVVSSLKCLLNRLRCRGCSLCRGRLGDLGVYRRYYYSWLYSRRLVYGGNIGFLFVWCGGQFGRHRLFCALS